MSATYVQSEAGLYVPNNYTFFVKPNNYDTTNRQLEEHKKYTEFINWGRRNPILFSEEVFGIEFLDYQKYIFMMSWDTPYVCWCMSRNGGKSILGAVFIMTKTLLIPNHTSYILCGVGSQSIEMFTKIEMLSMRAISSFKSLTDVFSNEVVKSQANTNGFVHNPASYRFNLYNNSKVFTLNGAFDNNRSKRSNLNFYDEAMNSPEELFKTSEPFTTQNAKFGLGTDYDETDQMAEPSPFYNQLLYASSAGRTDQYFFQKYRDFSLRMDAGDKRYFCADISSDVVINATKRGVPLPEPLLSQETVDMAMRENKETGLREYKNIFTTEGGDGQAVKRADIIRNSFPRLPLLYNETNKSLFAFAYDPARSLDNSVVAVGEFFKDPKVGWKMRLVNVTSFVDVFKKDKTPMNTPNQIKELKKMIVTFNGKEVADHENILSVLVDAGSGGAGVPITDFLCEDWVDEKGVTYRGLVDDDYNEGDAKKYPNAVKNKLRLLSPGKYKTDMYESLIKMMELNLIEFTEEYLNKGYINLIFEIDAEGKQTQRDKYPTEKEEKELSKKGITIETIAVNLDRDQELVLRQIDAAKNELVNIYRFEQTSGKDRFDLAPDKANKMNDDRADCIAMLGWQLAQLRRENIIKRKRPKPKDLSSKLFITKPKIHGSRGKVIG